MTRLQLRALRQNKGFSLRKVAGAAGISHQYLDFLEGGEKPLNAELKRKILNAIYRLDMEAAQNNGTKRQTTQNGTGSASGF
jgi:transcriptional regulator with XRE-family HTH domain